MRIVVDVECDKLVDPTQIWVIVCKDIDTGDYRIFREVTSNEQEKERFLSFMVGVDLVIGHNIMAFDVPVLHNLLGYELGSTSTVDTFIVSKMAEYSRVGGHSIETYGYEFKVEKGKNFYPDFFTKWSQPLEDYCVRDVDICHLVYLRYVPYIQECSSAVDLEHQFQLIVNDLHTNGFAFNIDKAKKLLSDVQKELDKLDADIQRQFPPKQIILRTFTPKATKFGTINRSSVPRSLRSSIHEYEVGIEYPLYGIKEFNPASHKQVIEVLNDAKWSPIEKTKTHVQLEREINSQKRKKRNTSTLDTINAELYNRIIPLRTFGWKINEANLATLPPDAPSPARTLARRILYEARRRTLTEWIGLFNPDTGRIHGSFAGIGAWTHRMSHQKPNMANIPNATRIDGSTQLLGKEMRSLWIAPKKRLLVGVDAEGIQLRIFAHYIDDPEFTDALVRGSKLNKTDPHSLNQRILGSVCKSRAAAKRFIYALLLGAGLGKLSEVLDATKEETQEALDRLLQRYTGFAFLKEKVIPKDANRGYFVGLDGRKVGIPGATVSERSHLAMSGYLQNGETVVMKRATVKFYPLLKLNNSILVDLVHDEWQTETVNVVRSARTVAELQSHALYEVGQELGLKCPMAGSYWNDDKGDYTIGTNWSVTH